MGEWMGGEVGGDDDSLSQWPNTRDRKVDSRVTVDTRRALSSRSCRMSCQVFDKLYIRTTLPQRVPYITGAKRHHVIAYLIAPLISSGSNFWHHYTPCASAIQLYSRTIPRRKNPEYGADYVDEGAKFIIQVHLLLNYISRNLPSALTHIWINLDQNLLSVARTPFSSVSS